MAASDEGGPRRLEPRWDSGMIIASIAISLLGAFTSTQLMCQARLSARFPSILAWTILGSLTFGFCSIWCLHFVAMLACKLDLSIGIDVAWTVLSAALAVSFTFASLASDLLWEKYSAAYGKRLHIRRGIRAAKAQTNRPNALFREDSTKPLLNHIEQDDEDVHGDDDGAQYSVQNEYRRGRTVKLNGKATTGIHTPPEPPLETPQLKNDCLQVHNAEPQSSLGPSIAPNDAEAHASEIEPHKPPSLSNRPSGQGRSSDSYQRSSSEYSTSRMSSSFMGSSSSAYGFGNIKKIAKLGASPAKNAFITTGEALYVGCTIKNIIKGFFWSLAITSMHYAGIAALRIPSGTFTLDPGLVVLSALISWLVCLVGCILMSQIESNLAQQLLFSIVASTGVAAMHFTGVYFHHNI